MVVRDNAERLFSAIGELDERFIGEARQTRTARSAMRYAPAMAAALVVLIIISAFVGYLAPTAPNEGPGEAYSPSNRVENGVIDSSAGAILSNAEVKHCESLTLRPGNAPLLVWQNLGESGYRVVELSSSDLQGLLCFEGERVGERAVQDAYVGGVWIVLTDGRVVSPYLAPDGGNYGYLELFSYSPEMIPSENYAARLETVIKKAA